MRNGYYPHFIEEKHEGQRVYLLEATTEVIQLGPVFRL